MTLLDHDPRAIPLPQSVADAFDLPELFRLLERPVRISVLNDLLGDTAADAFELHQLLDVRGVDVDRRGVRGVDAAVPAWGGAAPADHGASDPSATRAVTIAKRTRCMEFLLRSGARQFTRALASKAIEPAVGGTRQRPMSDTRPESTYRYRSSHCRSRSIAPPAVLCGAFNIHGHLALCRRS